MPKRDKAEKPSTQEDITISQDRVLGKLPKVLVLYQIPMKTKHGEVPGKKKPETFVGSGRYRARKNQERLLVLESYWARKNQALFRGWRMRLGRAKEKPGRLAGS